MNAVSKKIHAKPRVRDEGAKVNQDPTFILAHRLPEIEALIFSVARDLPSDPIFVLSHEGFVANIHIDTKELEAEVLKRTGFQMPFSSKVLGKK